jgi:glutamyl-Q tRNA(Asp) synthetase
MAMSATSSQPVFRFAPSPNGRLHRGHAFSALLNEKLAQDSGGRLLLRIEDVDRQRARPEYESGIINDLNWLGIAFDEPPRRQSDHLDGFAAALAFLEAEGLAYPSFLSRKDIAEVSVSPDWPRDPDGAPLAPDTDRLRPRAEVDRLLATGAPHAIRLDLGAALHRTGAVTWSEDGRRRAFDAALWGDVVLKSRDGSFAYHLAVVVDDAAQGVSDVVRGYDLLAATAIHRILQLLLGLPEPLYRHHALVLDETGEKLAKSRFSPALADLRAAGVSADRLRRELGFAIAR